MLRFLCLIILLIAISNLEVVNCLQCYDCSHCPDPVQTGTLSTETCEQLPKLFSTNVGTIQSKNNQTVKINQILTSNNFKNISNYGCLKIIYKNFGDKQYNTSRRCTTLTVYGKDPCEYLKSSIEDNHGEYIDCSICDQNLCNSAQKIRKMDLLISYWIVSNLIYFFY